MKSYYVYHCRAKVTFGLNTLNGKKIASDGRTALGDWDSSNAESLIRYTVSRGYNIHGWELGMKLSPFFNYSYIKGMQIRKCSINVIELTIL